MLNGLRRPPLALLVTALAIAACGAGTADPVVARHMGAYYEAFVGRDLTPAELRELTDQVIRLARQPDIEKVRAHARAFDPGTGMLEAGGATAETQRDWFLSMNYFRPALQNTIEMRLMTEGNPVRVTDRRSRRVMTERDIVALANIRDFARANAPPRHRELSRAEIESAVTRLEKLVGGDRGQMPQFFEEASAFWIGVQQEWPRLNAEQRNLARAYAARTWRVTLPPQMYQRLWGLPQKNVFGRQIDDAQMRIAQIATINAQLGNLPVLMDAIFPP